MNLNEHTTPIGDRRQPHRTPYGDRMFRQRIYLMADVWAKLDALMHLHGYENVNQILTRIVRDAHSRVKAEHDDCTRTQ